jgi:hypothetical protein
MQIYASYGFDGPHKYLAENLLQLCAYMLPKTPDEVGTCLLMVVLGY